MSYNIVTNYKIISDFKNRSKYFKVNLGIVNTIDKSGDRILNNKDNFAYFYNNNYKTTIFAQGNIGDIRFYIDHYIKDDVMAFYYKEEEFLFDYDRKMIGEKGVDFFLGHIIKKIETEYEERIKEVELKKSEPKILGDPTKISKNPGLVNYEDIKAYLNAQNKMRYEVKNDKKS